MNSIQKSTQKIFNPCLSCGACCASFRISYHWSENVPDGFFNETNQTFRSLKSKKDQEGRPRCTALDGEIGKLVACGIYENRPSPCRDFRFSYEDGGPKEIRCDESRIKAGMQVLSPLK